MYRGYGNNFYTLTSRGKKGKRQRMLFTISVFVLLYLIIIVRLAQVMIFEEDEKSVPPALSSMLINRADIVDRNGIIIATSLPTVSLYACPHEMLSVEEAVSKISSVFPDIKKKNYLKN